MIIVKLGDSKAPKIELWSDLGMFREVLGATWGLPGRSWKCFGRLGRVLMGSWEILEASRDHGGSIFEEFYCFLSNLRK